MGFAGDNPYIVSWRLTRQCSLRCGHCTIDPSGRGSDEFTPEEARFVIDELSYFNTPITLILGGGDPLFRGDIAEIIAGAWDARFTTFLETTGLLLTPGHIRNLTDAGLRGLIIPVDSAGRDLHDRIRGVGGAWDAAMAALRHGRENRIETQINVSLTNANLEEIDGLIELGAAAGVRAINFFFLRCTGAGAETVLEPGAYESALRLIAGRSAQEKRLKVRPVCAPRVFQILSEQGSPLPEGARGCLAGRRYVSIGPDGTITPCPFLPVTAGNIKEHSFVSIWEDAQSLALLRGTAYSGRCGVCEYREVCGGCRIIALAAYGDFMSEDPSCLYQPTGRDLVRR